MTVANAAERRVEVWDAPTRLFHWSLIILILVAWFTGEGEGAAGRIHVFAGSAIAGMLVFRLLWGFIGGEHARFSDFAAGPKAIAAHVRDLFSSQPHRHLGHNPLGGLAVFLLLAVTAFIVGTGLFSGEDEMRGPFAGLGPDLSEVHEAAFRVLQALVVVHVFGVIVETVKSKDALVPAMVRGWKLRRADEAGANAKRAGAAALAVAVVLGAVVTFALITSAPQGGYAAHGEQAEGGEDD
jgi:cytochrome b